ncbi:MAG: hypothetical protein RL153_2177 [Verrucomicrobiota bacterium]
MRSAWNIAVAIAVGLAVEQAPGADPAPSPAGVAANTAAAAAPVRGPKANDPDARQFWSFVPPSIPAIPAVQDSAWPRGDIDRFLLSRLEAKGLRPVEDADPRTLARRLAFDLTGLPPDPDELDAFVAGPTAVAWEAMVDRLLASRAFGERWGRHWLDVARYGESTGKERNYAFPEAWRYRDWVIEAVAADMPYDDFIRRQVAGDLLPVANEKERDANLVATGFLALGPKGLNERRREQFVMDVVDEQIDVTTRAVLGVSVACARCHDHKFDPISQRDYYAMAGIFRSTQTLYGTTDDRGNRQPSGFLGLGLGAEREDLLPARAPGPRPLANAAARRAARRPNANGQGGVDPERALPPLPATNAPRAMGVREGIPHDSPFLVRGEVSQKSGRVPRGLVPVLDGGKPMELPAGSSGRLQLAEWLVRPENPLSARVAANRVWMHLMGRGIVATPDDFGFNGDRPTHPELLDYLALRLRQNGWSIQGLVREIVLSRSYALSSAMDPRAHELDPDNTLHWRFEPRRLDAEALRDAMLAVSGMLEANPPKGSPVSAMGDGPVRRPPAGEAMDGILRRRSVYLPVVRGFVPESLDLFDFAEPSLLVAERDTTNVPSQALYLLNNPQVIAWSRAFARRLLAEAGLDPRERVARAYRLALGRAPTSREMARALEFVRDERLDATEASARSGKGVQRPGDRLRAGEAAWTAFTQALLASAEFRFLH